MSVLAAAMIGAASAADLSIGVSDLHFQAVLRLLVFAIVALAVLLWKPRNWLAAGLLAALVAAYLLAMRA
jgi:hypothetical protein